jgi:glucokinase
VTAFLLADIGGTNARFALARSGSIDPDSIASFKNADHADFDSVLSAYLKKVGKTDITACCLALAGQVNGENGTLTNRSWGISATEIRRQTGCGDVTLINDLFALGHAVNRLGPNDIQTVCAPVSGAKGNGQAIVVNVGTGFNTAFVLEGARAICCSVSETGHVSLPISVARQLADLIGQDASARFPTIEHLFSGRGLAHFYAAATHQPDVPGDAVIADAARHKTDHPNFIALNTYARMLGTMLSEVSLLCPPDKGIYLVGSVAQALIDSRFGAEVQRARTPHHATAISPPIAPLYLIKGGNAGLLGCLSVLS